jgi:hypothetical protein
MKCIECVDCNTLFTKFVHNQTRCAPCVDNKLIKEGSLAKKANRNFFKACEWCAKEYKLKGPASRYCSEQCRKDSKRCVKYGMDYKSYCELVASKVCSICNTDGFVMDASRYDSGLVIDHCHETGTVRGMLCHNCNRALGLFQDNISLMKTAINYLERATTIPQGSTPKQVEAQSNLKS